MLDELNPQQREVAQLRQHCVAIACPGAGKTKTIATKAALLLQDKALKPVRHTVKTRAARSA